MSDQAENQDPSFTRARRLAEIAHKLELDVAAIEVLPRLESAGVPVILLKGRSLARWLYDDEHERTYSDLDLLVPTSSLDAAGGILSDLGFRDVSLGGSPYDRRRHADEWVRGRVKVDLHHTLLGVQVGDRALWEVLSTNADSLEIRGTVVQILNPATRAFHVALHAAQHGPELSRPQEDLIRAVRQVPLETWHEAAQIAHVLDATEAFATGLRLVEEGRVLAEELNLQRHPSVEVVLRASAAGHTSLGFEHLSHLKGWRQKTLFLAGKLFPPPTFMRAWSATARRGWIGLLISYPQRLVWLVRHVPTGFKAWRAARRQVASADAARDRQPPTENGERRS